MIPSLLVMSALSRLHMQMHTTKLVIPFKGVPYADAVSIIHSPEKWGSGAGLMSGIDPFDVYDVSGPFVCGSERMVYFRALGHRVRLTGYRLGEATATIAAPGDDLPHTLVRASVWKANKNNSTLSLRIESKLQIDALLLSRAMRVGLFGCADANVVENEAMRAYRSGLVEFPP